MKLQRTERDNYVESISTDPVLTGAWQASFDGGDTWIDGLLAEDGWAWLVAGPDFDAVANGLEAEDTQATIPHSMTPLLRIKDDPVLSVKQGTPIRLRPTL